MGSKWIKIMSYKNYMSQKKLCHINSSQEKADNLYVISN